MSSEKIIWITLGSITVMSLITFLSHTFNIIKHLSTFWNYLRKKVRKKKGRKEITGVDEEAHQLLNIIETSEYDPGILSRLQWARYLADSKAIISNFDGSRELDLKALFVSGGKSVESIKMDIDLIIKHIIKEFGVIDAVFGYPYNDDFVTICYDIFSEYKKIRQELISPAENPSNIPNLLESGSRVIILSACLTLENFQHLKNWIDSINQAHQNIPCTIIGGFILFREKRITKEKLVSLFSDEERLIQPFKLDLGHR